jgi:hypothetical protein
MQVEGHLLGKLLSSFVVLHMPRRSTKYLCGASEKKPARQLCSAGCSGFSVKEEASRECSDRLELHGSHTSGHG